MTGARLRRGRALCAAALAIVLAAVTLLAGWHQATVLHARCAEHGELYHVGGGGKRVGDHRIAAREVAGADEHDHCTMCPRAHDGAAAKVAIVRVALPPVAPAPIVAPRVVAIVTSDAYRDAPKTSPPTNAIAVS
jgi:hypothetical protein